MDHHHALQFIFELGHLKKIRHEGWRYLSSMTPESVGEHALRAAQIGYLLAHMEQHPNPYEVCTLIVFHDIGECRTGDLHLIARRYGKADEHRAVQDQTRHLGTIGQDILRMWHEAENCHTPAGAIAKDADILEQAITAKERMDEGLNNTAPWIEYARGHLRTDSAKKLLGELLDADSNQWWKQLGSPQ